MAHNHKEISKPKAVLLFLVALPFIVVGMLIFGLIYIITTVIPAPVEMIIYKNSRYYKDTKAKYTLGITGNFGYKSYKHVIKNPKLEFVLQKEGYYYYKAEDSVLVIPYYISYFYEDGNWYITEDDAGETKEKVENAKEIFQNLISEDITPYKLRLLVKESYFRRDQLSKAKENDTFVFYKSQKDFARLLI